MADTIHVIPETLQKLRARTDLSMDALARAMGYKRASSIQRYMDPKLYGGGYLRRDLVEKLAAALVGKGKPRIRADEVWALAGPEFSEAASTGKHSSKADVDAEVTARLLRLFADAISARPIEQKVIADLIETQLVTHSKTLDTSTKHES